MEQSKVKLKVGVHEFEAAGPPEEVRAQLALWKEMVQAGTVAAPEPPKSPVALGTDLVRERGEPLTEAQLMRIFSIDASRQIVRLQIPVDGERRHRDSILLIVYGFLKGLSNEWTKVTALRYSLEDSGLPPPRISDVTAPLVAEGLMKKMGTAKGGKYSLTARGVREAETLIKSHLNEMPPI